MGEIKNYEDPTKYYVDKGGEKLHAKKGTTGHKDLALRIIDETGLAGIWYAHYSRKMDVREFPLYAGYILVDETPNSMDSEEYAVIGYCSKTANPEELKHLHEKFNRESDMFDDVYPEADKVADREQADEIISRVSQALEEIERKRALAKEKQR